MMKLMCVGKEEKYDWLNRVGSLILKFCQTPGGEVTFFTVGPEEYAEYSTGITYEFFGAPHVPLDESA